MTCDGSAAHTSCTNSTSPRSAAVDRISRQMARTRGSRRAIACRLKCGASGRRYSAWPGGSMASSIMRIMASWSGSRSSITTPPSEAEKRFGWRATCTTSACLRTAQHPAPPSRSCQYTGWVRRRWANTSCGGPSTYWSGSKMSIFETSTAVTAAAYAATSGGSVCPMTIASQVPTAVHIGADELPFVDIGDGSKLKVLQVKEREGLWIVENVFTAGYVVPTHRHTGPVYAYTTSGAWRYKEYEYVNRAGSFLYEPAGSVHTLGAVEDDTHVWFQIYGANLNLDADGNVESVFDGAGTLEAYYALCEA